MKSDATKWMGEGVLRIALSLLICCVGVISPVSAHNFGTTTTGGTETATETQDNSQCTSKNPIYYFNGRETHVVIDIEVKGIVPIILTRKYDSRATYDSPLGYGWAFDYDRRLYEYADGSIIMRTGCGRRTRFVQSAGAWVTPASKIRGQLMALGAGRYVFRYQNGEQNFFDAMGRLEAIEDPRGNRLEFEYDSRGRLPLTGTSPYAIDTTKPMVVARTERLVKIVVRGADGNLTTQSLVFSYSETTGRLQTVIANDGRVITYEHDVYDVATGSTTGNLLKVTGLEGVVSTYQYADTNDRHNLTYFQEGASNVAVQTQYDNKDRAFRQTFGRESLTITHNDDLTVDVVTVMDVDGAGQPVTYSESYEFYPDSYVSKYTDGAGYQYLYFYTTDKLLSRKEIYRPEALVYPGVTGAPAGAAKPNYAWRYEYNASGNRTKEIVYQDNNELVDVIVYQSDNEFVTKTWIYDKDWVASEQTVSILDATKIFRTEYTFYYDTDGYPTNIKEKKVRKDDGTFQTTTYAYDSNGRLQTTTLPDAHIITNVYTGAYLTSVYQDNGTGGESPFLKVNYDYDAQGNRNWIRDANGNITTMVYDSRGRVTQITNALNEATYYTYTDDKLTQIEVGRTAADGPGQITQLTYTAEGWLETIQRRDDSGAWLTLLAYTYDKRGKPLSLTEADNGSGTRTSLFQHDAFGRLIQVSDPSSNMIQYAYNALGNRISVIDANNNTTWYGYDALSRLTKIMQTGIAPSLITRFTYDAVGNLTAVTDAKNQTTTYEYDALSNNTAVVQPMSQRVEYYYDNRNRLDYLLNARKQKIDYEYERWGPVKAVRYYADASTATVDRTVSYSYHYTGVLNTTSDSALSSLFYFTSLDKLNRVSTHYVMGLGTNVLRYFIYSYDRYGNRNGTALYQYEGTTYALKYSDNYTYNTLNRLDSAGLIAPTAMGFSYYDNGALKQTTHSNTTTTDYTYEANGPVKQIQVNGAGVLGQRDYVYDNNRNINSLQTLVGLHDYTYDGLNRLTQAVHPAASNLPTAEDFAYDGVGNREDVNNATLWDYDTNNRLNPSPDTTYTYDDDGNMVSRTQGGIFSGFDYNHENRLTNYYSSTSASYAYDPFGRRVKKTTGGVSTWFLWDGDKLMGEYDDSGNLIKRYAYLPGNYAPAQMADSAGNVYTVHSDHLDTPKQMTDSTGKVVWSAEHTAYGESTPNEDVDGDGIAVTLNVRAPGQYYDDESKLHYNYFRYYDPRIGRYITADPIGLRAGPNVYAYVSNNPLGNIDPYGLIDGATMTGVGAASMIIPIPGARVVGAVAMGIGMMSIPGDTPKDGASDDDADSDSDSPKQCDNDDEEKDKGCEAIRTSILASCASMTGTARMKCIYSAEDAYNQCMNAR